MTDKTLKEILAEDNCPNNGCYAAEAAERISELEAALKECSDELEAEIEAHYKGLLVYPVMQRKRARDLEIIDRARKLLEE